MNKYFEIRWHGRGGQGVVTGAKSLAKAVQGTGKHVVAFPEYGPERRGAPVKAFNRFSDEVIRTHTPVRTPNLVIIADPTLIGNPAVAEGIDKDTRIIINSEKSAGELGKVFSQSNGNIYTVPANRISRELFGRELPNSAIMGAIAKVCGDVISLEDLMVNSGPVFEEMLGAALAEKNLQAIKSGYEETGAS